MKKKYVIAIIIGVLLLVGLVFFLIFGIDKKETDKGNTGNDVIVHESDDNTVEEKVEDGLQESDSEDGPVLDENNMIDFNGGDTSTPDEGTSDDNASDEKPSDDQPSDSTENEGEKEDEDSKETGTWGTFY